MSFHNSHHLVKDECGVGASVRPFAVSPQTALVSNRPSKSLKFLGALHPREAQIYFDLSHLLTREVFRHYYFDLISDKTTR